jgi:hypothetical protein
VVGASLPSPRHPARPLVTFLSLVESAFERGKTGILSRILCFGGAPRERDPDDDSANLKNR